MPLQLGGIETERNQVVLWDPNIPEEELDAKKRIDDLLNTGFYLDYIKDGEAKLIPPSSPVNQGCMRILSQNGDDRVIWDRSNKNEVKEAFNKFRELLKKGYTAYATNSSGSRGHKITEFDPGLEEVIFAELREVVLVPKVVPG